MKNATVKNAQAIAARQEIRSLLSLGITPEDAAAEVTTRALEGFKHEDTPAQYARRFDRLNAKKLELAYSVLSDMDNNEVAAAVKPTNSADTGTAEYDLYATITLLIQSVDPKQERDESARALYEALQAVADDEIVSSLGQGLAIVPAKTAMQVCKRLMARALWQVYANEQRAKKQAARNVDGMTFPQRDEGYKITERDVDELHGLLDLIYQSAFIAVFPGQKDDPEILPYYSYADSDGRWHNATSTSGALVEIERQAAEKKRNEERAAQEARVNLAALFAGIKKKTPTE